MDSKARATSLASEEGQARGATHAQFSTDCAHLIARYHPSLSLQVVHTPTTGKAEPAARSLTLYTTIPILFLTGDQVDTVLKVLQFW